MIDEGKICKNSPVLFIIFTFSPFFTKSNLWKNKKFLLDEFILISLAESLKLIMEVFKMSMIKKTYQ